MSNPVKWRGRGRTTTPNARQKRNKLFIDAHPKCQRCGQADAQEAHHDKPHGHPDRYDWRFMKALCIPCHVTLHQGMKTALTPRRRGV